MPRDFVPPRESTPEEAAVTGGAPAAAEPPPTTRGRQSAHAAFAWMAIAVGLLLIVMGLIADQATEARLGTIIAGVTLGAAAILTMAGLIEARLFAALAFAGGAVLAVAAVTADRVELTQAVLLGAGAFTFLGGFGALASSRRFAARSGDEEPRARVESV